MSQQQLCKYVKCKSALTDLQIQQITDKCIELYTLEQRIKRERLRLQGIIDNEVTFANIHIGEVLELDRELLAIEPDAYIVKVRELKTGTIDYITKAQLR